MGQRNRSGLPLIYSCSGCSSVAQLANTVAVQLDREGSAEMSCIAGVGGEVPKLVKVARSGRPIVAVDGCPLVCVAATLKRHGVTADVHHVLSRYGVKKRYGTDCAPEEMGAVLHRIRAELPTAETVSRSGSAP